MFRIAICDDEPAICSQIENIILSHRKSFLQDIEIEVFHSGIDLYEFIEKEHDFDLIFLDIEMENLSGVETGKLIREKLDNQTIQIVYVSGRENYYKELFEIRPMDFLLKPIKENDILNEVRKAMKLSNRLNNFFVYKKGYNTYKIPVKDIIYFESKNREIKLVTVSGEDMFYGKLKDIYVQLAKHNFLCIHKSYVVNYLHISIFKYDEVIMSNNAILTISQLRRKEIREIQLKYEREESEG